jgi:ferritin-like metal-binding protein YciE
MEGLVEESKELLDEIEKGAVLDAALIGAAQKVEHYEIASYGTLIAMAKHLKLEDAVTLLQATLVEEKGADEKLTKIAEQGGNQAATLEKK